MRFSSSETAIVSLLPRAITPSHKHRARRVHGRYPDWSRQGKHNKPLGALEEMCSALAPDGQLADNTKSDDSSGDGASTAIADAGRGGAQDDTGTSDVGHPSVGAPDAMGAKI